MQWVVMFSSRELPPKSKSGDISHNAIICRILYILPCWIYTISFLVYVYSIWPSRFNFLQWNANLLFVGVKFSLINILFEFVRPIEERSMFFNFFLLRKFPFWTRWQASISCVETFTSVSCSISITSSSRFSSSTLSGTPLTFRSFRRPYCSNKFPFSSKQITFFSRLFILLRNR